MIKKLFALLAIIPFISWGQAIKGYQKTQEKVILQLNEGQLQLTPLSNNAVRVQFSKGTVPKIDELVLTSEKKPIKFKTVKSDSSLTVIMPKLKVLVNKANGVLSYYNANNKVILKEKVDSRILKESSVQGEACYIAAQSFHAPEDEFIYGTGQFQDGYLNIKGLPRRLTQVNSQISIPFILSNKGYGLLWHNYGLTDFNPATKAINLKSLGTEGEAVTLEVTTTEGTKTEKRQDGVFTGMLNINKAGKYAFFIDVGQKMARKWQLTINGEDVINFKNHWLPPTTSIIVDLKKGVHNIVLKGEKNDKPSLYFQKVKNETVFSSPVAKVLDYVVFAGNADDVISTYRDLTGKAPMMPIWSLGYIHCRERYHSQVELLENASEFRQRNIPLDLIVQDWQYWGKHGWNSMKFDEDHYPDPAKMVRELHDMDIRLMLSVWSKIDKASELGKAFNDKNYYIPNTQWVDFFNPEASKFYWENFSNKLLKPYQIDGWWQDATEPENDDLVGRRINNNTLAGEWMRNVYPLFVTKTVYEGLRKDAPDKRAFILTRSGFSGQQKYAAALWTGDIGNNWQTLRRQVTAGLNTSITGIPWWTFDAGGFFRPGKSQYTDKDFHERFLRWLQFATFSPLQRVHGYQTNTEFWRYGSEVEKLSLKYLNLRYRLLPYIYSQAANVTLKNGTIMRPLVMDFAYDKQALEQLHIYMFGPSFLVAPVLEKGVENWPVYLPNHQAGWFNFWTGKHYSGNQTIKTEASISTLPLYVKAGSIVAMGEQVQNTEEIQVKPIEIRIYTGASCSFELYEDEGTNYNYEKGAYSIIPFKWNEDKKTLEIGKRKGSYKGMLNEKTFKIVWVNEHNGIGLEQGTVNKLVKYDGKKKIIVQ
ncbi:glycosyl hydrolase family 31 [Tamlana nanhaiensis]|uniref:Glycosyl hydrolase family 31 n=1 Tax=Neotamlana nanhaiensis TaxID=1382798 RepID=A0A0D7WAQ2_9FLAO|nr:TIM-barrel domain-containing protein [Tamlana nanhaiensis]KJD34822.1 glycosyl hydrolase family 31 [Tamlana nanhaiensis]